MEAETSSRRIYENIKKVIGRCCFFYLRTYGHGIDRACFYNIIRSSDFALGIFK